MAVPNSATPGSRIAPLPYVLAALVPFGAGTILADLSGFPARLEVFVLGAAALAVLVLAAAGSREFFAPGAGRFPSWGPFSPPTLRRLNYGLLGAAALLCVVLQVKWRTGNMTIPLGAVGLLGGYFYFAPPLEWHRRGWGEVLGALWLGMLPVVWGYYLQCNQLVTELLLYALPLTFAAFNFFLIHGFPPLEEEGPAPDRTMAARLGPVAGALVFTLVNILTITGLVVDLLFPANPLPFRAGFILLILLAVVNQELIKQKAYRREARIKLLCHLTLAQQLAMGLVYVISLWLRW
ncbi:MAG: prenyltransferase [Desulfobaccales bacterium]